MSSIYDKNDTCYLKESAAVKTYFNVAGRYLIKSLIFLPISYTSPNSISILSLTVSNQSSNKQPQSLCSFWITLCHHSSFKTPKSCPIPYQIQATKYDIQGIPQSGLSISWTPWFIAYYMSLYIFCSWMSTFHCNFFFFCFKLSSPKIYLWKT